MDKNAITFGVLGDLLRGNNMIVDELEKTMLHQDLWFGKDFSRILAKYNPNIGDAKFFNELIFNSVVAGSIIPRTRPSYFSENSDFSFLRVVLINWANSRGYNLPDINKTLEQQKPANDSNLTKVKEKKTLGKTSRETYKTTISSLEKILESTDNSDWKLSFCNNSMDKAKKSLDEESGYLFRIFLLINILTTVLPDEVDHGVTFSNKSELINYMVEEFEENPQLRLSKRTLEDKFSAANNIFKKNLNKLDVLPHQDLALEDALPQET